jgi:hypothetical protein
MENGGKKMFPISQNKQYIKPKFCVAPEEEELERKT